MCYLQLSRIEKLLNTRFNNNKKKILKIYRNSNYDHTDVVGKISTG